MPEFNLFLMAPSCLIRRGEVNSADDETVLQPSTGTCQMFGRTLQTPLNLCND